MGIVIAAAAASAASTFVVSVIGATVIGYLAGAVVGMVVSSAVGRLFGAGKGAQQPQSALANARAAGQQVNMTATDEPIPVLYGYNSKCSSISAFKHVAGGAADDYLYRIHVLCEGEIEAIDRAYIDDVISTDPKFSGLVTLEYHTGADAQAASTILTTDLPAMFASSDIGAGIAYAVSKIKNDPNVFTRGEPLLTYDVRGKRLYDPRDAGTRFSNNPALVIRDYWTNIRYGRKVAAAKIDDAKIGDEATYYEARETVPDTALTCTADAATNALTFAADHPYDHLDGVTVATTGTLPAGLAAATTYYVIRVDRRTISLASSVANALTATAIDLTSAGSGTHTAHHVDQQRYTCDGMLDPMVDAYGNLDGLLASCRSWFFDSGGTYHLICDKPQSPAAAGFDESNMVGPWSIDLGEEDGHYNRVSAQFIDAQRDNQPNFAVSDNSTERTADGGKLMEGTLRLPVTTNLYRAQRIAQLERRKSRLGIRVVHRALIGGFEHFPGDVVPYTHASPGWTAKPFRIVRIDPASTDELEIEAWEYSADVWTLDAQAAMVLPVRTTLPDTSAGLDLAGLALASGTAALFVAGDGTVVSRIKASWTAATSLFINSGGRVQVQYKKSADSLWISAPDIDGSLDRTWVGPVDDGVTYDVRARFQNRLGGQGNWAEVNAHSVVGKTAVPSDVTGFQATQQDAAVTFVCDPVSDADLDLVEVRQLDFGDTTWANGISLANILRGHTISAAIVPPGNWTFLAKARDTTGNYSTNATRADLTVTAAGYIVIREREEAPDWIGTHSATVVSVSGALICDSALLANQHSNAELFEQFVSHPSVVFPGASYGCAEIDKGKDSPARIWVDVVSTLGPGVASGQATPLQLVDHRTEAGSYDGLKIWSVADANFRRMKTQVMLVGGNKRTTVSSCRQVIDRRVLVEEVHGVSVGASGQTVTFTETFHTSVGFVNPALTAFNDGASALLPTHTVDSETGTTLHLYNTSGTEVGGTGGYRATGI